MKELTRGNIKPGTYRAFFMAASAFLTRLAFLLMAVTAGCASGDPSASQDGSSVPQETAAPASEKASKKASEKALERASATTAGKPVTLRLDEALRHQDLVLRWLEIEDSRCPIGVTCIWAGQMQATLEVSKEGETPLTLKLLRKALREPEVAMAFGYELRLLEVNPHPKGNKTFARGDYTMRLEIR